MEAYFFNAPEQKYLDELEELFQTCYDPLPAVKDVTDDEVYHEVTAFNDVPLIDAFPENDRSLLAALAENEDFMPPAQDLTLVASLSTPQPITTPRGLESVTADASAPLFWDNGVKVLEPSFSDLPMISRHVFENSNSSCSNAAENCEHLDEHIKALDTWDVDQEMEDTILKEITSPHFETINEKTLDGDPGSCSQGIIVREL